MTCSVISDTPPRNSYEAHNKVIKALQCSTTDVEFIKKLVNLIMERGTEENNGYLVFEMHSDPLKVINKIKESGYLEHNTLKRVSLTLEIYL